MRLTPAPGHNVVVGSIEQAVGHAVSVSTLVEILQFYLSLENISIFKIVGLKY